MRERFWPDFEECVYKASEDTDGPDCMAGFSGRACAALKCW